MAEIFKYIDDNEVVHYTANRASIPIRYQDTVKIVRPPASSHLFRAPDVPIPEPVYPEIEGGPLPPGVAGEPGDGGADVVGGVLSSRATRPSGQESEEAASRPARRTTTARLGLRAYSNKSEGWWRSQFIRERRVISDQRQIVDAHRKNLRKIIKSHASGNEVLPLEDDPEFQKMARILPREENRLNQFKRSLRKLEARANELRISDSWRR
jgi:hypothetical protein